MGELLLKTLAAENPRMRWLRRAAPVIGLLLVAAIAYPWLVGPSCPKRIVIATGGRDGAYFAFANRYREILHRDGVDLEVRSTAGSVENLKLLQSDAAEPSLAIVQGGVGAAKGENAPESLASLYLEPVWVFCRGNKPVERLAELKGKKIAIGAVGSGTRMIALELLRDNDVVGDSEPSTPADILPLGGREAADALKQGNIDAAFFVISPQSAIVRDLFQADNVSLMSFRQASAYRRKHPYLSSVLLSEGLVDLKHNIPSRDIVLLAPTANLVARKGLHPALVPLLLKAAFQVHENGGFLEEPGVFPSLRHIDFPANADADRYFKSGPTFFYRFLPFGIAAWLDQMKLILLPLCTLLIPILKLAPPIYRWRIRSKIYRWYRVLREVDQKMKTARDGTIFAAEIETLRELQGELAEISVPLSYMEEFYNLRQHISYVLSSLERQEASIAAATRTAA